MFASEFDYILPPQLVAQFPSPTRDGSRLMVLRRPEGAVEVATFQELPFWLKSGDLLIFNDSRVIYARLRAEKTDTGAKLELLLLDPISPLDWWCLIRPGKRVSLGTPLRLLNRRGDTTPISAVVLEKSEDGHVRLAFSGVADLMGSLPDLGEMPLPPYIRRPRDGGIPEDSERYQTVYARVDGSVAAPTAGLHFTPSVFASLQARGVETCFLTLHVGYGTFAPVKALEVEAHRMHRERFDIPSATAAAYNQARGEGRRIIAVGTTSLRVLETVVRAHAGRLVPGPGQTDIFIHPPQTIQSVAGLLTNFHLPQSTLLMLVSAFAVPGRHPEGRDLILRAYGEAIRLGFRFFSYGDAMLIV